MRKLAFGITLSILLAGSAVAATAWVNHHHLVYRRRQHVVIRSAHQRAGAHASTAGAATPSS